MVKNRGYCNMLVPDVIQKIKAGYKYDLYTADTINRREQSGYILGDLPDWTVGINHKTKDVIFRNFIEEFVGEIIEFTNSSEEERIFYLDVYYSKPVFIKIMYAWGLRSCGVIMDTQGLKAVRGEVNVDTSYNFLSKVIPSV